MLEHLNATPADPARVVILGASGFVGAATHSLLTLHGIATLPLGSKDVDLLAKDAAERLRRTLQPTDSLLVISAAAPCKNHSMLADNINMMAPVCAALEHVEVAHVVYVSSDAVYRDSRAPMDENACAEPGSLHGAMHLARELMLKAMVRDALAILRPTLIYGAADPHNGYGPNRFRRLAEAGDDIVLFGEGEEQRDHVLIDDVAELIVRVLRHRSAGILNVATGQVHSFRSIAEQIVRLSGARVQVRGTPRVGPMPHGGYRAFDAAATHAAFPDFRYTSLAVGLARAAKHRNA